MSVISAGLSIFFPVSEFVFLLYTENQKNRFMKKSLVWIVLLGLAFSFNACKDDPDPIPAIVGTWSRVNYKFTELPNGFTGWEGTTETSVGESNYTLVIKNDGTYTRAFTLPAPYNLNDKGKWTLDGTAFKLSPDDADDLDLIEQIGWPGTEFSVVGDISDIRLTMSRVVTVGLASDADIEAAGGNPNDVPDEKWVGVDVTVVYTFDKLQ